MRLWQYEKIDSPDYLPRLSEREAQNNCVSLTNCRLGNETFESDIIAYFRISHCLHNTIEKVI